MDYLNSAVANQLRRSDGRYLSLGELGVFEQYLQSYQLRLQAYGILRTQGEALVMQSLRRMAQTYPELIQAHGPRCKYDMTEVLRYIALAVLRDDVEMFKEQMFSWLDTVLVAYKRNLQCSTAYRYLQEAIGAQVPEIASLTRPYLEILIESLQSHA